MDSSIKEAVEEYYQLKKKYESQSKGAKSKQAIDFSNKGGVLKAYGNQISIEIVKGTYVLYKDLLVKLKNDYRELSDQIISNKLNLLFSLINESEGINRFQTQKEALDEIIKTITIVENNYDKMLNRNERDIMIENEKINETLELYKENMTDYMKNKSIESLKTALNQNYKILTPAYESLRKSTRDICYVDYDDIREEYVLNEEYLSLENSEILNLNSAVPKIVG